ncbi:MAG TPA: RNA polymerase sigma-70 factor [Bacteroidales bacterium]|jgi:RNA polymerase sigma-70 factor (ECF subfamily)|nr:RNA polymerase sigma-70 factor [Bacteroidales bacterium]
MTLTPSDRYIVESIKAGNKNAFEFLFKTYYPDLKNYANNIVGNEVIAEDMVMDVFVRLWELEKRLEIKTSIAGYLFTSVHNHCINYLTRKHNRFPGVNGETIDKLNALIPLSSENDAISNINLSELSERIEQGMGKLPDECRKIFMMSRMEGMTNREIADKLGISENTVKVQIYRALNKFRVLLKEFLPDREIR